VDIVGSLALLLALFAAAYAFLVGIVGIAGRRPLLTRTARYAGIAIFPLVSLGVASLLYLFFTDNFSMAYVAEHSSRALPSFYKFAALWAGQEGSLLFWSWLLSIFTVVALLANRRKHADLMPHVTVILGGIQFFFLLLNNFVSSPFAVLGSVGPAGSTHLLSLANGQGLNPLLQYPEMVLHPPLLYLGYTGFAVPFAFALAALLVRSPGEEWIHIIRRWTIVAWSFLGIGILLGAHWAYAVLGWGGYWAWDPVENASLLPWITATAFLHAVVMQEKRGMMKVWTVWLLFTTFLLGILGTLITRSGIVSSVHAFGKSSIGIWLTVFLAVLVAACFWAYWNHRAALRTRKHLDSLVSRESSFLFGSLILAAACLAVLWGTLLPVFTEWVEGSKITIGPPFFNKIAVPIALLLLVLMGITPLLVWGRNSFAHLRGGLTRSLAGGLVAGVVAYALGFRQVTALACLFLSAFAITTIVSQFVQGGQAMASRSRVNFFSAVGQLMMRDTRRYGGYIVHLGIVLIFVGISGQAFNRDVQKEMRPGGEMKIGPYTLVSQAFDHFQSADYEGERGAIEVLEGSRSVMMLHPERRFYPSSQVAESRVAIYSSLARDLYVVYEGDSPRDGLPVLHAYLNPLVHWIWLGGLVMVLGTLLALFPNRRPPGSQQAEISTVSARRASKPAPAPEPALVSRGHL
jgi:cytochrome c-type biogenesis protein CcmF